MCQVIIFLFSNDLMGVIVLLSWGSVGSVCVRVCEQSPKTSFLKGFFSLYSPDCPSPQPDDVISICYDGG